MSEMTAARWTGHEEDHKVYDLIFDESMSMLARVERTVPKLLLAIINAWEKDFRSIPITVISAALEVAEEAQEIREMTEKIRVIEAKDFPEET